MTTNVIISNQGPGAITVFRDGKCEADVGAGSNISLAVWKDSILAISEAGSASAVAPVETPAPAPVAPESTDGVVTTEPETQP